jgi:hypothetical protein
MMALINLVIIDAVDFSQTTVQVPIGVAANVCGVTVAAIAQDVANDGSASCTADVDQLPIAFQPNFEGGPN